MHSAAVAIVALTLASDPATAWPEISGRWARMQQTTALVEIPFVGETDVTTVTITVADVTQNGANLEIVESVCAIESEPVSPLVRMRYLPAFLKAVSGGKLSARLSRASDAIEYIEPENTRTIGRGDDDGDGHPGVTVRVEGIVSGEVYVRQRGWQSGSGRVMSDRRIAGHLTLGVDQTILGASASVLESAPPSRPHPERDRHIFRMVKVPKTATCDQVLERRKRLLGV